MNRRLASSLTRCSTLGRARSAFTLVELIVVVTIIVLVLAIAVPGLARMNREMRQTAAQQSINSTLLRANYLAQAERCLTAVRFMPAAWDVQEVESAVAPSGRQHMVTYRYVGSQLTEEPPNSGNYYYQMNEYFERMPGMESVRLPEDTWAAPLEALYTQPSFGFPERNFGADLVLRGVTGHFMYNCDYRTNNESDNMVQADDFLIVFDPVSGLRGGPPTPYRLRAYSPEPGVEYETDRKPGGANVLRYWYQRFSFSGVVTYTREGFVALGNDGKVGYQRQEYLRSSGRPFLANRFSGALMPGAQRPAAQ